MNASLVSVIIPVYNTAAYLDECLASAAGQSYRELEIILVDDDSTDNSLALCRDWEKRDSRIRAFSIEHGGAGAARNFGLLQCNGQYVMFLDSDDWWDKDLLEKAVQAMETYPEVDFVWFDLTVHWPDKVMAARTPALLDSPCHITKIPLALAAAGASSCDKIFRKSFLDRIKFRFPSQVYEDIIVNPWLYLSARSIFSLKNKGYHYRCTDSTSMSFGDIQVVINSDPAGEAVTLLQQENLLTQYPEIVKEWVFYRQKFRENIITIRRAFSGISDQAYADALEGFKEKNDSLFPEWRLIENNQFLAFGSYSLRSALNYSVFDLQRIRHYQFSSLAAAFCDRKTAIPPLEHPSPYRASMLSQEQSNAFAESLAAKAPAADFLCLDLLEERFPLLDYGPAGWLTKSDALDESLAANPAALAGRVYERGEPETEAVWQESCLKAIALIKKQFRPERVILVRTLLAEAHGEYGPETPFENAADIRSANARLEACYDFFEKHFKGIQVMNIPEKLRFSDTSFKHGCAPWHLNDFCYYALAAELRAYIAKVRRKEDAA